MHHISSIQLEGFRGAEAPISLPIDQNVNFIIGRNGTGKTTLINLINAALAVDIRYLAQSDFKSVLFKLKSGTTRNRPWINVFKTVDDDDDLVIRYEFASSARGKKTVYDLDASESSFAWSKATYAHQVRKMRHNFVRAQTWSDPQTNVRREISKLVRTSWISVHRAAMSASAEDEARFESPVDRKLHQVARDFGTYFSTLDALAAQETDKFQKIYLLSLISPPKFEAVSSIAAVDADEEKAAIKGMFAEFNVASGAFSSKLDSFTKRMARALENYGPSKPLLADDLLVLTDTVRIHDVVKEWHKLIAARAEIYKPKKDFIDIMNALLYKKSVEINIGNEPIFLDSNGDPLLVDKLSSGEKQLFILLGETLLQRRAQCVFMADEPELSLHIDWQEKLVPSLRRINPNAQVIFATHSPDIVGKFRKNTIDLEKLI